MERRIELEEIRELLDAKKYTNIRQLLSELNEADIAFLMEEQETEERLKVFRILPKDLAADVFSYLETDSQETIINSLSDREAGNIIDNLMADDAADLLEEMPANVVERLLANANPDTRQAVNQLLRYPEDSAGSIMTTEFVDLKRDLTVADALKRIRRTGVDKETINICYVTDTSRRLLGLVSIRTLLLADQDDVIEDIMETNVVSASTMDDREDVAQDLSKYDFLAMPVVDKEHRLVGIVTIDDAIDVMEEEATEDFELMAAITPTDKPYLRSGVWETVETPSNVDAWVLRFT